MSDLVSYSTIMRRANRLGTLRTKHNMLNMKNLNWFLCKRNISDGDVITLWFDPYWVGLSGGFRNSPVF